MKAPHNYRAVRLRSSEDGAAPQPRGADDRLAETHTRDVAWCVGHTRARHRVPLFSALRGRNARVDLTWWLLLSLSLPLYANNSTITRPRVGGDGNCAFAMVLLIMTT